MTWSCRSASVVICWSSWATARAGALARPAPSTRIATSGSWPGSAGSWSATPRPPELSSTVRSSASGRPTTAAQARAARAARAAESPWPGSGQPGGAIRDRAASAWARAWVSVRPAAAGSPRAAARPASTGIHQAARARSRARPACSRCCPAASWRTSAAAAAAIRRP